MTANNFYLLNIFMPESNDYISVYYFILQYLYLDPKQGK
jgi:hypothetical protein